MKITAQEEYGLRCLIRLSEADGQSLTLPDLAAAEGLSVPYVAKLMTVMHRLAWSIASVAGQVVIAWPARHRKSVWAPCFCDLASHFSMSRVIARSIPGRPRTASAFIMAAVHSGPCGRRSNSGCAAPSIRSLWRTFCKRRGKSPNCCVPGSRRRSSRTRLRL